MREAGQSGGLRGLGPNPAQNRSAITVILSGGQVSLPRRADTQPLLRLKRAVPLKCADSDRSERNLTS